MSTENAPGLPSYQQPLPRPKRPQRHLAPWRDCRDGHAGRREGMHIWQRMAVVVRFRRIDMIEIMHARDEGLQHLSRPRARPRRLLRSRVD